MTGKTHERELKHSQPYQENAPPAASEGMNDGLADPPVPLRSAAEMDDLYNWLPEFSGEELKQICVLGAGARLEADAVYLRVQGNHRSEVRASGAEEVGPEDVYIPQAQTHHEFWDRLTAQATPPPNRPR